MKIMVKLKFYFRYMILCLINFNIKGLFMFTTISLINAVVNVDAKLFDKVEKTPIIKQKVNLVFSSLPEHFLNLLENENENAINVFNEIFSLVDNKINLRTIDRYRRLFVADRRKTLLNAG